MNTADYLKMDTIGATAEEQKWLLENTYELSASEYIKGGDYRYSTDGCWYKVPLSWIGEKSHPFGAIRRLKEPLVNEVEAKFNPNNLEHLLERAGAIEAKNNKKPVQFFHQEAKRWMNGGDVCFTDIRYRAKPEPKTRPWSKPEDVPGPNCYIHPKGKEDDGWSMILSCNSYGVTFTGRPISAGLGDASVGRLSWRELCELCDYSTDRKTWSPCTVTE